VTNRKIIPLVTTKILLVAMTRRNQWKKNSVGRGKNSVGRDTASGAIALTSAQSGR
jgi:hypothetical protein